MVLFRDRYRVESARHSQHDYSLPGWYHVTICTTARQHRFGAIRDGQMALSRIGTVAQRHLELIPEHFPHIRLDEFQVMPNHIHTLLEFKGAPRLKGQREANVRAGDLGAVIGAYKGSVTHWCKENKIVFGWQPRFHDQILRSGPAIRAVQEYIRQNVTNWAADEFNVTRDRDGQ
jgi:putative transposase